MTTDSNRLGWLPPALMGAAAATAAEVSASLLIYTGPGLVRSITTVLAVEAAALALGVWTAPAPPRDGLLEAVRRRWILALGAFVLATVYSAAWSLLEPVATSSMGQGGGLALMAALPLYACGTALGGMDAVTRAHPALHTHRVAAAAFGGAVLGFAVTGYVLPRALAPASLFLGCLILLSAGGLVWGGTLDRLVRIRVRGRAPSPWGEVRVEDRRLPDSEDALRVLWEGGHVRRWLAPASGGVEPWELNVLRRWAEGRREGGRILLVGGGASALPQAAVREFEYVRVDVLERNRAVVELAREHLEVSPFPEEGRVRLVEGPLGDGLEEAEGEYDLVIVDTTGLGPEGGADQVSRFLKKALRGAVASGGALVVGPHEASGLIPLGWLTRPMGRTFDVDLAAFEVPWPREEQVHIAAPAQGLPWLQPTEDAPGDPVP